MIQALALRTRHTAAFLLGALASTAAGQTPATPAGKMAPSDTDPEVPGPLTAVQDQLGLKLQPAKVPGHTLVVDPIDPPTEK